ncbi:MAG: YihA family ribosome biogenesis GTP-binding protein [Acidiphilium sp. 37-64-53]|uniref:ribosome biogenesis GTP-binding protein YihA/YsxC n=1 Tax=Acidiphilium TaxID=522 RepID=UPI000BD4C9F8|nr:MULTISPECIES: ribosome biogenesis GTP-binding protein YihA/YsxC [Acidiphilium]MCW8307662.1 ribosome biogenesis GTP-binding protein YihA/YsxC [Acidiphilium sp. PA]OYW02727.1 MAG: YihA family ribosome biogenesis GTP-binding protein [Acidiphilium sp. 37-64-53]OZB29315.1 MAG: YihA family ribosome biogenesis GTP-binding protein [Acidiphilium sp. 34-64-41]HQT85353.1 ribosome biogenesis GTP-binding protein YihA/YsxC [Acidiphilium rubrum]
MPEVIPPDPEIGEAAALEAGRLLFAQNTQFVHAAQTVEGLLEARGIEVALAGRSNVGKSTLINAITGHVALARVAQAPGRTRQLNFFQVGEGRLSIVDMPGYGYAEAPKAVKRDWQGLMFRYLRGRPNLRRVLLLMDARIEDKPADHTIMGILDKAAVAFQIVLTKADKMKPEVLARKHEAILAIARKHPAALNDVIVTSSETGLGIAELRASIAALVV